MGDLPNDASTLPANTAAVALAAQNYLADPTNADNRDSFINAVSSESNNLLAVASDLNEIIQSSPNAAAIAKAAGISGFIAGAVATVTDAKALVDQINKGETDPATVLALVGDLATTATSGVRVAVELSLIPEEAGIAAAAAGLYGGATLFAGAGLSAMSALMSYEEAQTGGDEVVVVANVVTYDNGLKGAWSDAGDDGNGNPTQSTYQTWDPSTGQVVGSLTVPFADKQALSQDGMTITNAGQQEIIGSDGSLTHIDNGSSSQEANGMQRVFETDGSTYVQAARDGEVDIGDSPVGTQTVDFNGTTAAPYQSSVAVDTSGLGDGSQTTVYLGSNQYQSSSQYQTGASGGTVVFAPTQASNGLSGNLVVDVSSDGTVAQSSASIGAFSVNQSGGTLSVEDTGQGGLAIMTSSGSSNDYSTLLSGQESNGNIQISANDISGSIGAYSTNVTITGNGNTIQGTGQNTDVTVITDGAGNSGANVDNVSLTNGTVDLGSSDTNVVLSGQQATAGDATGVTGGVVGVDGSGNTVSIVDGQIDLNSSGQSITVDGSNDSVQLGSYTGDQITLGANQTDYIYGSNETIMGQSGDNIVDYGNNNNIYADGATVTDEGNGDMTHGNDDTIYGNGTGDGFTGTGDTGGTGYTGGTGGTGGSGSGGTYGGSYGFDDASRQNKVNTISSFDKSQGKNVAAAAASLAWSKATQAIAAATTPGTAAASAINTARWGKTTITWSFADGPTSGADPISGAVQSQYQAAVAEAFQTWAAASGLTFKEVASGTKSDIAIGWGNLDPSDSGVLGYTSTKTRGGVIQPGATIRLEDPSEDALVTDASGTYTYGGTTTTLEQLVLHEIGHSLGMAESSSINSIMFPELSANNTTPSTSDLQEIAILYPQNNVSLGTTAMAQAMASFSAREPAAGTISESVYAKTLQPAIAIPAN